MAPGGPGGQGGPGTPGFGPGPGMGGQNSNTGNALTADEMLTLSVETSKLPKPEELKSMLFPGLVTIGVTDQEIRLTTRSAFPNLGSPILSIASAILIPKLAQARATAATAAAAAAASAAATAEAQAAQGAPGAPGTPPGGPGRPGGGPGLGAPGGGSPPGGPGGRGRRGPG